MRIATWVFAISAALAGAGVAAQTAGEAGDTSLEFELPGAGVAGLDGDGGLDFDAGDIAGGPLKRLASRWPEDLVIAPIPGRSPQIGWNLALAGGYFLQSREQDPDVSPSIIGGFGMFAENGSYAYGGGANLHLFDDKLRVKVGAGYLDVRYRFYGIGNEDGDKGLSIDILQEAPMYFAQASWRVWNRLYLGLGYLAGSVESRLRFSLPESPFLDPGLKHDIAAISIPIQFDSRDHEHFPREGWLINAETKLFRDEVGSDFDAEVYKLAFNHYRPVRDRDVLAFRGVFRYTGGDAPFFLLSTFGGSKDLRGYPSGRYRDSMLYALQSEYRWQAGERWILTGFAGFGEVAESLGKFGRNFLPAAGVGARFVISEKHRISLSTDVAVGNDGTEFYFGVGEAF